MKKSVVIDSKTDQLPRGEINRMIRDSEIFAEGDRKIKERADAKNDFETSVGFDSNESLLRILFDSSCPDIRIRCATS